jgi:hypothetical protein
MKKITLWMLGLLLVCPSILQAEDFLGAPVMPGVETVSKTESRLEMKAPMGHDEVLAFYRKALKEFKSIKYRNWRDATYIEDDGKMPWHSITISKVNNGGTTVVIMKDNWTWILGTLLLRYIGVFVVLLFLLLGMSASGAIISRSVARLEAKKAEKKA